MPVTRVCATRANTSGVKLRGEQRLFHVSMSIFCRDTAAQRAWSFLKRVVLCRRPATRARNIVVCLRLALDTCEATRSTERSGGRNIVGGPRSPSNDPPSAISPHREVVATWNKMHSKAETVLLPMREGSHFNMLSSTFGDCIYCWRKIYRWS